MDVHVYGISTCSTCKRALAWLRERGIPHTWIDTRQSPPSRADVRAWVSTLGNRPLRNTAGQSYRALDPRVRESQDDERWVEAFAADPMLLKRPLLVMNGQATLVGFQPGAWESALTPHRKP